MKLSQFENYQINPKIQFILNDLLRNPKDTYQIQNDCVLVSIDDHNNVDIKICDKEFTAILHQLKIPNIKSLKSLRVYYSHQSNQAILIYQNGNIIHFSKNSPKNLRTDIEPNYQSKIMDSTFKKQFILPDNTQIIGISNFLIMNTSVLCMIINKKGKAYLVCSRQENKKLVQCKNESKIGGIIASLKNLVKKDNTNYQKCSIFLYASKDDIFASILLGNLLYLIQFRSSINLEIIKEVKIQLSQVLGEGFNIITNKMQSFEEKTVSLYLACQFGSTQIKIYKLNINFNKGQFCILHPACLNLDNPLDNDEQNINQNKKKSTVEIEIELTDSENQFIVEYHRRFEKNSSENYIFILFNEEKKDELEKKLFIGKSSQKMKYLIIRENHMRYSRLKEEGKKEPKIVVLTTCRVYQLQRGASKIKEYQQEHELKNTNKKQPAQKIDELIKKKDIFNLLAQISKKQPNSQKFSDKVTNDLFIAQELMEHIISDLVVVPEVEGRALLDYTSANSFQIERNLKRIFCPNKEYKKRQKRVAQDMQEIEEQSQLQSEEYEQLKIRNQQQILVELFKNKNIQILQQAAINLKNQQRLDLFQLICSKTIPHYFNTYLNFYLSSNKNQQQNFTIKSKLIKEYSPYFTMPINQILCKLKEKQDNKEKLLSIFDSICRNWLLLMTDFVDQMNTIDNFSEQVESQNQEFLKEYNQKLQIFIKRGKKLNKTYTRLAIQTSNCQLFSALYLENAIARNQFRQFISQNFSEDKKKLVLSMICKLVQADIKRLSYRNRNLQIFSFIGHEYSSGVYQYFIQRQTNIAVLFGLTFKSRQQIAKDIEKMLTDSEQIFSTIKEPKQFLSIYLPFYSCQQCTFLKLNIDLAKLYSKKKIQTFQSIIPGIYKKIKIVQTLWKEFQETLKKYMKEDQIADTKKKYFDFVHKL